MKKSKSLEDYLEDILILSGESEYVHRVDVARMTNVSEPAVEKAVKILETNGYVRLDGMHIVLTAEGKAYASKVYHRHKTIRDFLLMHGVSMQNANNDACEMEHVISDETFAAIEKYVEDNGDEECVNCPYNPYKGE